MCKFVHLYFVHRCTCSKPIPLKVGFLVAQKWRCYSKVSIVLGIQGGNWDCLRQISHLVAIWENLRLLLHAAMSAC